MSESPISLYSPDETSSGRAVAIPGAHDLIHAVPELLAGKWQLSAYRVLEVRKQRRKRIVFGVMSYRDGARTRTRSVVTKVYGSDRGERSLAALRQLWLAGFRAPASHRVPRPFGYERDVGALYQGHAPGVQWANLLCSDRYDLVRASRRAAAWLTRLQATAVDGVREPPAVAAKQVRIAVRMLSTDFSESRARLATLGRDLARELSRDDVVLASSHGDYHPKNVFLSSRSVTVIDFDTFGLREPAHDVGYAIAQLLIMSFFRTGSFGAGVEAAAAFGRALARSRTADWTRQRLHVARSFLQSLRYELCTLRNGRRDLLERWPDVAELACASDTSASFLRALK